MTHPLDNVATAVFAAAAREGRTGELLQCLFDGGSCTVDAARQLRLISSEQVQSLRVASIEDGEDQRDEAIEKLENARNAEWRKQCRQAVLNRVRGAEFTTDDVWDQMAKAGYDEPRENRSMGAVIIALAREDKIAKTGRTIKTTRPQAHARDIPVWRIV